MIPRIVIRTPSDLISFVESLESGTYRICFDEDEMLLLIGDRTLDTFQEVITVPISSRVEMLTSAGIYRISEGEWIVAIGGHREFDLAKRQAMHNRTPYAVCPTQLDTDAFATDRYDGGIDTPARIGTFPSAILLDQRILCDECDEVHVLGLGEAVSLLTSICDFQKSTSCTDVTTLIPRTAKLVDDLIGSWQRDTPRGQRLARLATTLLFKGLLIRVLDGNGAIAACDHLGAYELRRRGFFGRHGELVLIGSILTAELVLDNAEEWIGRISRMALERGLLQPASIAELLSQDLVGILLNAANTRPQRASVLQQLTKSDAQRSINLAREVMGSHA